MLDLAFLVIAYYVVRKASIGEYRETACNLALVVGIFAGIAGCVVAYMKWDNRLAMLNVLVMALAFALRFAAKRLAKLYNDKERERSELIELEIASHRRFNDSPVYTDDTFDDEELRFGKGGWTDPKL